MIWGHFRGLVEQLGHFVVVDVIILLLGLLINRHNLFRQGGLGLFVQHDAPVLGTDAESGQEQETR